MREHRRDLARMKEAKKPGQVQVALRVGLCLKDA